MSRNLVIAAALAEPWALMPEYMTAMATVLARWQAGTPMSAETREKVAAEQAAYAARAAQANNARAGSGGAIAVINVFGSIMQRASMFDDLCGGASCERLLEQLHAAEEDNTIGQILINFSSPGGSVYGIQEAGAEIARINKDKPIVGVANSLSASAAYWLMSQCGECYVTPGGEVGSIGVWQAHQDISKALAQEGVDITLISAGKFKVEGNPYAPLDDDAKGFMQLRTDQYYDAFVKAVARGRGVGVDAVRSGMGQGRVLGAQDALAENMVDGIATFDDVVKKMQRAGRQSSKAGAAVIVDEPQAAAPAVVGEAAPEATATEAPATAAPTVDHAAIAAARARNIELLKN